MCGEQDLIVLMLPLTSYVMFLRTQQCWCQGHTLSCLLGEAGGDMLCLPVAFTVISILEPDLHVSAARMGVDRMNSASRSSQRSCMQECLTLCQAQSPPYVLGLLTGCTAALQAA